MSRTKRRACSESTMFVRTESIHLFPAIPTSKDMVAALLTNQVIASLQRGVRVVIHGWTPVPLRAKKKRKPSVARKTAGFSGSSKTKR